MVVRDDWRGATSYSLACPSHLDVRGAPRFGGRHPTLLDARSLAASLVLWQYRLPCCTER
jgi:hypothetical protein